MTVVDTYDVVVVGAGNAGLVAALAAAESGARVLVLETAPEGGRGGNSRFAGGIFRCVHDGLESLKPLLHPGNEQWYGRVRVDPYTGEDYAADWMRTSEGRPDPRRIDPVIRQSFDTMQWMTGFGVEWELTADKLVDPEKQDKDSTITLSPGGAVRSREEGVGLVGALFAAAEKSAAIDIAYESTGTGLEFRGRDVVGVQASEPDRNVLYTGRVILAAGGFEANPAMRLQYLGPGWDLVKVRGSQYNTGMMLRAAMRMGARACGHWGGAHAVPVDAAAPPVGDLTLTDKTSRYSYPYSLLVNRDGERFIDEGETQVFLTYAKTGWAVRAQPGGVAYQVFDQKSLHLLEPRYETGDPVIAEDLPSLAQALGISEAGLVETVRAFNEAVPGDADERFDPFTLDGVEALPSGQPARSNWARRLDTPPFVAYPVSCGITFTYGGLDSDTEARVIGNDGSPINGLYVIGEMSGGFFFHNYGAGAGLMRGAVMGRIAGRGAAAALGGTG